MLGSAATRLEPYATKHGVYAYGSGPRVADAGDGRIPGFGDSAPFEDLKLE
jgi:hypothetical protein